MKGFFVGLVVGCLVGIIGGIYLLPILTAQEGLSTAQVSQKLVAIGLDKRQGSFSKDRQDSDAFHWGEGIITVGAKQIVFAGELAPGPDYRLYLTPKFVQTEADFLAIKSQSVEVGMVNSYDSFALAIAQGVNVAEYDSLIIWCEAFGQFITSAQLE